MNDIEKLTEVYNIVRKHLLEQNARSEESSGLAFCRYRGAHNMNCAVGVLITDENYSESLEGKGVEYDEVMLSVLKSLKEEEGYKVYYYASMNVRKDKCNLNDYQKKLRVLLVHLQRIHDLEPVEDWPSILPENFQDIVSKIPYLDLAK